MDALLISGIPENLTLPHDGLNLHVLVLYTRPQSTLVALRYAAKLPHAEHLPVRLLIPQVVAYPLPLHQPPVDPDILAERYRTLAEQAGVDATVDIWYCRDPWDAVHQALATPHLVVIGGRRRWWPTQEERLAKRLRAQGHQVIYTESKREPNA